MLQRVLVRKLFGARNNSTTPEEKMTEVVVEEETDLSEPPQKEVEFSTDTNVEDLQKVTKFDYWSFGNADEISKWLFPLSFALWNFVYIFYNYHLSGRLDMAEIAR